MPARRSRNQKSPIHFTGARRERRDAIRFFSAISATFCKACLGSANRRWLRASARCFSAAFAPSCESLVWRKLRFLAQIQPGEEMQAAAEHQAGRKRV